MLYHLLYPLHTTFKVFNVFKYITFRSAGIRPCADRFDIGVAQPSIVGEVAICRIHEPGWHLPFDDGFLHRLCPGTSVGVCEE